MHHSGKGMAPNVMGVCISQLLIHICTDQGAVSVQELEPGYPHEAPLQSGSPQTAPTTSGQMH